MDFREKYETTIPHQLIMQNRSVIELTGITDVETFDDNSIHCSTSHGKLIIIGYDLHVQQLDLDNSSLSVEGKIDSLSYSDVKKGGLFGRLFR